MRLLVNAKLRKELSSAIKTLRDQDIQVTGPYRRPNGMLVFSVGNSVVTEIELLQLQRKGGSQGDTTTFSTKVY